MRELRCLGVVPNAGGKTNLVDATRLLNVIDEPGGGPSSALDVAAIVPIFAVSMRDARATYGSQAISRSAARTGGTSWSWLAPRRSPLESFTRWLKEK
jgi:hypothetical protein